MFSASLLSGGANIDAQITSGHTALHIAIGRNRSSNVIYLINSLFDNRHVCMAYAFIATRTSSVDIEGWGKGEKISDVGIRVAVKETGDVFALEIGCFRS